MTQVKKPNSKTNLDRAIERLCAQTKDEPLHIRRLLATVIVGQMLPDGAAKGGNALKIRFGKDATRFSQDLDTARASSLKEYNRGWRTRWRKAGTASPGPSSRGSRRRRRVFPRPTLCSRSTSSWPTTESPG